MITIKKSRNNKKTNEKFVVEPGIGLCDVRNELKREDLKSGTSLDSIILKELFLKAKELYENENALYEEKIPRLGAEGRIMSAILDSGTLLDRMSAISLRVVKAPVHNFEFFVKELFVDLAKKKTRRVAMIAIGTINEVLCNILPNRKLKYFSEHPLNTRDIKSSDLVLWYFENRVKLFIFEYLQLLEIYMNDTIPHIKTKSLQYAYNLLSSKPEQEKNILILILNKFEDSCNRVSSKAVYLLQILIKNNPRTKLAIVQLIDSFILKKHSSSLNARYVSLSFLTQVHFTSAKNDMILASFLIKVYLELLNLTSDLESSSISHLKLKKSGSKAPDIHKIPKIYSAIFTGIYRAFPYANVDNDVLEKLLDIVNTFAKKCDLRFSVKALVLILHMCSIKNKDLPDQFYLLLYDLLFMKELNYSSKIADFANLLYRSLISDISLTRVAAFTKRILQVCHSCYEKIACVLMHIVYKLVNDRKELKVLIIHPEETNVALDLSIVNNRESFLPLYNLHEKDPTKSYADKACIWELCSLKLHFHPTVAHYASLILYDDIKAKYPIYNKLYDPLHCNTLIRFLDKMTQKPPRTTKQHNSQFVKVATSNPKSKNRLFTPIVRNTTNMLSAESLAILDMVISFDNYKNIDENKLDPVEKCVYRFFKNAETHQLLTHKRPRNTDGHSEGSFEENGEDTDYENDASELGADDDLEYIDSNDDLEDVGNDDDLEDVGNDNDLEDVDNGDDLKNVSNSDDLEDNINDGNILDAALCDTTIDGINTKNRIIKSSPSTSENIDEMTTIKISSNKSDDLLTQIPGISGDKDIFAKRISNKKSLNIDKVLLPDENVSSISSNYSKNDTSEKSDEEGSNTFSDDSGQHNHSRLCKRTSDNISAAGDIPEKLPNLRRMAKRAKNLGYGGDFFEKHSSKSQDYASLSDFEDLLDN